MNYNEERCVSGIKQTKDSVGLFIDYARDEG